jgi:hypothetical protein
MQYAVEMGLDAKFHKYHFRHSKVERRGYIDTQTGW